MGLNSIKPFCLKWCQAGIKQFKDKPKIKFTNVKNSSKFNIVFFIGTLLLNAFKYNSINM